MKKQTIVEVQQLARTMLEDLDAIQRMIDGEALQVGDRHILDGAIKALRGEVDALSRTLAEMLDDPTKVQ